MTWSAGKSRLVVISFIGVDLQPRPYHRSSRRSAIGQKAHPSRASHWQFFRVRFLGSFLSTLALTLSLSLTEASLRILGTSTCPTAPEVQAALGEGSGSNLRSDQPAIVRLDQDSAGATLRLRVYDENGVLLGVRALPVEKDCHLLAVAAATLLRGLELELESPPAPLPLALSAPVDGKRPGSTSLELGAAGVGLLTTDLTGGGGALLLAALGIRSFPIRPELVVQFEAPRQLAVGTNGQGNWWRIWIAPGAHWRALDGRHFWLSLHLDVPVGAVVASGAGFQTNQGGAAFDLGLDIGVRAGLRFPLSGAGSRPALLPWLGLWGEGGFLRHALLVAGESGEATLPQLEAALGLGLSWSER
jgi:hypothetical protein